MPPAPPPDAINLPSSLRKRVGFAIFGIFVFAALMGLGTWQVHRYHYRSSLAAHMRERAHAPARAAPGPAQWPKLSPEHDQYQHLKLSGFFIAGKQILVHGATNLGNGFWVMTPLKTRRGFIVFINRGFVPIGDTDAPKYAVPVPSGTQHIGGLLRTTEPGGSFMRPNKPAKNRWYSRDVAAMAKTLKLPATRVAPYFVDEAATTAANGWPQGGMTKLVIYNHSLGYAVTWYLLAALTLVGAGIAIHHERVAMRSR